MKTLRAALTLALASVTAVGCGTSEDLDETTGIVVSDTDTLGETGEETGSETGETETGETSETSEGETGACLSDEDCGDSARCDAGVCMPVCFTREVKIEGKPPNVILVLDKSGSMVLPKYEWDDDGDDTDDDGFQDTDPSQMATPKVTRWHSLHGVVSRIVDTFDPSINLGATLFPSMGATNVPGPQGCIVNDAPETAISANNGHTVLASIPLAGATDLAGGTPAERGLAVSYDHLRTVDASEERIAILVTDGAANCSQDGDDLNAYDSNLEPTVSNAWEADNIATYVVGIAISDEPNNFGTVTSTVLNDVAEAGGVPQDGPEKFYNATNAQELEDALHAIVEANIPCTVDFPDGEPEDTELEVVIDGVGYGQLEPGTDCAATDGWILDEEQGQIQLCGQACGEFRTQGEFDALYECIVG